jgi:hypothetical protein
VVLDRKGKVQVHEQPRGWMGNGARVRACEQTGLILEGKWNTATEGTCEMSSRPREIHEEKKDERSLDVRQIDVNTVMSALLLISVEGDVSSVLLESCS